VLRPSQETTSEVWLRQESADMNYLQAEVLSHDAVPLFVRRYRSQTDEQDRTLVVVHGACEHGERYNHIARKLTKSGWNVIVADLKGHGKSGGVPSHIDEFQHYLLDLDRLWEHFQLKPETTAILGHSMGGLISARYVQTRPDCCNSLVLMSPLLRHSVPVPPWTLAVGKVLSYFAPRVRFKTGIDPAHATRNEDVLARRMDDQLMRQSVTAGWYFEMMSAIDRVWADAEKVDLPVLLMQGAQDKIVDAHAPEEWLAKVSSQDVTFKMLADHFHELLNEPDWRHTLNEVIEWLECHSVSAAV